MKSATTIPAKVKITAVLLMVFLSSSGLGYSVVKFMITDKPELTFLVPLFLVSVSILIKMFLPSIKAKKNQ
jgi:hypothetical protein